MVERLRTQAATGTASVGMLNLRVNVIDVDIPNQVAFVSTSLHQQRTISLTRMPGKGSMYPAPGETWMITAMFGDWMFMFPINPTPPVGNTANRPSNPQVGQSYFDTDLNRPIWFDGTSGWINATGVAV